MLVTKQKDMEAKLEKILSFLGYKSEDLLMAHVCASKYPEPGICMEHYCSVIRKNIPPEVEMGRCRNCNQFSVLSASELLLSV